MIRRYFAMLSLIYGGAVPMNAAAEAQTPRALTLDVNEGRDQVTISLIALSPVQQKISYDVQLTGSSQARHKGSMTISASTRQVLSTMSSSAGNRWCARVEVREEKLEPYTLLAGSCSDSN